MSKVQRAHLGLSLVRSSSSDGLSVLESRPERYTAAQYSQDLRKMIAAWSPLRHLLGKPVYVFSHEELQKY